MCATHIEYPLATLGLKDVVEKPHTFSPKMLDLIVEPLLESSTNHGLENEILSDPGRVRPGASARFAHFPPKSLQRSVTGHRAVVESAARL